MVWIRADKSLPLALCLINHPLGPTEQYVQASERGLQFIYNSYTIHIQFIYNSYTIHTIRTIATGNYTVGHIPQLVLSQMNKNLVPILVPTILVVPQLGPGRYTKLFQKYLLAIFQLCASPGWLAGSVAKSSVKGWGLTATDGKGGSSADPALYNSPSCFSSSTQSSSSPTSPRQSGPSSSPP